MNELIDLIAMQDIHPTDGLNEIKFINFSKRVGDLDEGVLDRLIQFSKKLTKLTVSRMIGASVENKKALVFMSEKILHLAPPITHLDFYGCFFNYEKSEDVLQKGKQFLHDISSISQSTLLSLSIWVVIMFCGRMKRDLIYF